MWELIARGNDYLFLGFCFLRLLLKPVVGSAHSQAPIIALWLCCIYYISSYSLLGGFLCVFFGGACV